MTKLSDLKNKLLTHRPMGWDDFPDIGLYKDQVVTYLKRQLISTDGQVQFTPAMISNYIKDRLLPKADGKRYNREHLAILTEIGLLKQVLQVKDIDFLLKSAKKNTSHMDFYEDFVGVLNEALKNTADKIKIDGEKDSGREDLISMALSYAIDAYCSKLACENLIALARKEDKTK